MRKPFITYTAQINKFTKIKLINMRRNLKMKKI